MHKKCLRCNFSLIFHSFQLLLIQTLISCVFSIFIYKYIVQQRRTWSAYLFGYGLVIPLACWLPFRLLEFSQVENLVLKMSFSTMPTIVVFKCLEAMYDTSLNTAVEASLQNYTIYYASLVNQVWDTKTNQRLHVTSTEFCSNLKTIFFQYMIVSVVRSYLSACQFQPFASNIDIHEYSISFQPGSLANNYCMALLTFYTLCVAFNLTGFVTGNLMGYAVKDVLYNPLVSTRSPRDFWRAQWNPVIGGALKVCLVHKRVWNISSNSYLTTFFLFHREQRFFQFVNTFRHESPLSQLFSWVVCSTIIHGPASFINTITNTMIKGNVSIAFFHSFGSSRPFSSIVEWSSWCNRSFRKLRLSNGVVSMYPCQ